MSFRKVAILLTYYYFVTDIRHSLRKDIRSERIIFINLLEAIGGGRKKGRNQTDSLPDKHY